MKLTMYNVRKTIREALQSIEPDDRSRRMSLENLISILVPWDEQLTAGKISKEEHDRAYRETQRTAGWTSQQFDDAIDQRWDYIDSLRAAASSPRIN